ncbi:autophagy-related protein 9A [Anopheles marshallii]|uniref:autophagy-related protein 9A n=1 Tax=Anopheles marshallii TaxID=1521116 RepID=UPI00237C1316|nr:autophagy-related protein 9A [Anopheles marshallii]
MTTNRTFDPKTYDTLTNQDTNPFADKRSPTIEEEDTPQVIHVVPETSKARWNHIEDLDSFFTRVYIYHQKHGFYVMMLQKLFELFQFVFVVVLITYMFNCIDYGILFRDKIIELDTKVSLGDAMIGVSECAANLGAFQWLALVLAGLFWTFRLFKFFYQFFQFWDIKMFYNTALKIEDADLDNLTWHEVQKCIREVQSEIQMSINKEQLTELDIYHRILRFKNYMVAMMNKSLLPATSKLPLLGNVVLMSQALRYNIGLILFWGPWSPFENSWHLREEYKRPSMRNELAAKLSKQILWVAIANFILSPFIFICQLMYFFFNYADLIKKEPGTLGVRCWSQYGKLYLRHFNELDHELDARLTRAYRPAVKYMNSFSSPLLTVIARNIAFDAGGVASLILLLAIYDEDVFQVQHVLTLFTILGMISVIARSLIPDENMVWCPEQLLRNVLAHVHYLPSSWRGFAHSSNVRDQFELFFQLKIMYILNELFSPLVAPFVLLYDLRPKSQQLVDFFRNFTVDVVGVGDVCSFAQMDVRKHGNPDWQIPIVTDDKDSENETPLISPDDVGGGGTRIGVPPSSETHAAGVPPSGGHGATPYNQGEHGKTELSLVHFTLTNPTWQMPPEAKQFVQGIKRHALQDLNRQRGMLLGLHNPTAMGQSLLSMESMGAEYSSIIQPILQTHNLSNSQHLGLSMHLGGFGSPVPPMTPAFGPGMMPSTMHQQPAQHGAGVQSSHQYHFGPQSYDFERMLQQNLTDASTVAPMPSRSTFLEDIHENDDEAGAPSLAPEVPQASTSSRVQAGSVAPATMGLDPELEGSRFVAPCTDGMVFSTRGGMSRREGPAEGSRNGLLSSLYGDMPTNAPAPYEFTTADMCLSTLYLHELHHNRLRRHGGSLRLDMGSPPPSSSHRPSAVGRFMGQGGFRPFGSVVQPSLVSHPLRTLAPGIIGGETAGPSGSTAGGSSGSIVAAERTPLLGGKKS